MGKIAIGQGENKNRDCKVVSIKQEREDSR